jgi:hypothetical protein
MKRRSPTNAAVPESGVTIVFDLDKVRSFTRRQLVARVGMAAGVTALTSATVSMLSPFGAAFASGPARSPSTKNNMTPEIKLVDAYNTWFLGGEYAGDMEKLKAGLPKYITNETVLHEAVSLPWGGTIIGYEGWVRLCQTTDPIFEKLSSLLEISVPQYYQHRNVVLHEVTMTIRPTKVAPEPFIMGIIEKYTIENGRIKQIDEFYADTASFLDRLSVLGVLAERKK